MGKCFLPARFRFCKLFVSATGLFVAALAIFGADQKPQDPLLIRKNGKWGYADITGRIVINPQYSMGNFFENGWAKVWDQEGIVHFINARGDRKAIPNAVSNTFCEGLIPVKVNEKYGYVNEALETTIIPQFDYANDFSEGLASVKINDKFGYIDRSGKFVIRPQFDDAKEFSEGLAAVGLRKAENPNETAFMRDNNYGYINKAGDIVIKPAYDDASRFSEGVAAVSVGGPLVIRGARHSRCGYIDKTGKVIIALKFYDAGDFSEGIAAVKKGDKYGYIDKNESFIILPRFETAREFQNGVAFISIGKTTYKLKGSVVQIIFHGKSGYINRAGKSISPKLCWRS
jgi:hypothetical protein